VAIAAAANERHLPAGTVIVEEGGGRACFVVAGGQVTLQQAVHKAAHIVGTLGPGDMIGADAFLSVERKQTATAVATSDVDVLELDAPSFQRLLEESPRLRQLVAARAERAQIERLIRATRSFEDVTSQEMNGLLRSVERRVVEPGTQIVMQGESGSEAYVIADGHVEVIDESTQRNLATLGRGALFGEAALLSDITRNASVRASEKTTLLVLARDPLLDVLSKNASAKARMLDLLNSRDRPLRAVDIEVHRQTGADGIEFAVLKNPAHHTYLRLSGDGLFLWDRSNGTNTVRDLMTALFSERRHFAPQEVVNTIQHLRAQGFLKANAPFRDADKPSDSVTPAGRLLNASLRALTATAHFDNVDPMFAALYRAIGPAFFTRPAALVMGLLALAGIVLFALSAKKAIALLWTPHGFIWFFALALPAYAVLIVLHEIGHGLGVKAIGRKVESIGIGWYWFGPIAFVDTSDAWVGTRAQRILVSASGLAVNLLLGAIASAIAFWASSPWGTLAAWQFALAAYIGFVENLNPLLEFDGYYILVDILDRPNLRHQSLRWLGSEFHRVCRKPQLVRGHVVECTYAIGAILYIFFAAAQSTVMYHLVGQQRLAHFMPAAVASALAWVLPIGLAAVALIALFAEIRKIKDASAG